MTADSTGRSLFIVDNSVSGWTGLRYLEEWADITRALDVATGFFEIGALLALDGKWQNLEKIRVLMGAETTSRTRKALLDSVRTQATKALDLSIESDKQDNPFLHGVPVVLEGLRSGQIECRIYDKGKFHAKTYITHAKLEVVGSQALVGSSNFTKPGLTENIELNVQIQSAREVAQLQEWFETHWNEAAEVTDAVIETIARHTHRYTPFDVYAKALQEYFRGHELTATEWDETRSKMFPRIDRYQQEAYRALMKIARQHGGAFLCDGVGLGKTFVGLMLIDEAHHFRNPGTRGDEEKDVEPSRYYRLYDLLDNATRAKTLFLLTATPINNRLSDFRHMAELFTRRDETYFARTLGVNNLRAHFNQMEKVFRQRVGHTVTDAAEQMSEAQEILAGDAIFRHLVVQRSRSYARESQIRETYGRLYSTCSRTRSRSRTRSSRSPCITHSLGTRDRTHASIHSNRTGRSKSLG